MSANLQDLFLNRMRKQKTPCAIHLTNGFQFKNAVIYGFDSFVILIEADGERQTLLYKHAISSITPSTPIPWEAAQEKEMH